MTKRNPSPASDDAVGDSAGPGAEAVDPVGRDPRGGGKSARLSAGHGSRPRARAPTRVRKEAARIAVRWLPVEALTPDPRNARLHSARQVARIADSIQAFGFNVPVVIDGHGGVLAGHGRLLAARRLGLSEVPTIALDHLSEAQRRAFMLADNRLQELASWDDARLGVELKELKTLDLDFSIAATGFTLKEIELRIGAGSQDAVDSPSGDRRPSGRPVARRETGVLPDALLDRLGRDQRSRLEARRSRQSTVARAGDEWTLGPHRLVCGDAAALSAIDEAIRRWQAVTGDSARLHSGGAGFDEVARARQDDVSTKDTPGVAKPSRSVRPPLIRRPFGAPPSAARGEGDSLP